MRGIASHAPRLKALGRPKALGSRRSGRAGEPPEGVGKPCRCPASPAASLLPGGSPSASLLPGGSPARSLWVIISAPWYYSTLVDKVLVVRWRGMGVIRRSSRTATHLIQWADSRAAWEPARHDRTTGRTDPGPAPRGGRPHGHGACIYTYRGGDLPGNPARRLPHPR